MGKLTPDSSKPTPEAQLEAFIDRLDAKNQKLFRSVRAALSKRFPTANELAYDYTSFTVVTYSPNEQGIDGILTIAGRDTGVDLYFSHGPELPDPKKLLQGSGKQTRFVRVESARQLSHPDIEALIVAALDRANVPLPKTGKGGLFIKTNKMAAAKKKTPRRKPKRRKP